MGLVPRLPRAAWIVLAGDFMSALGSGLTAPFLIVYLHRVRGIDLTVAGLALASLAVASFAGNVIGGSLADRVGPRRALMAGLLCSAGGAFSLAFVTTIPAAFASTSLLGLGNSIAWPALDSLLATSVDESRRSNVFALRHATLNLGFGGGALLAASVVAVRSTHSFQLIYFLDAATFAAFVPLLVLLPGLGGRPDGAETSSGGYRDVIRDRRFVAVWMIAALFVTFGFGQYEAALPPYATSTGRVSIHELGFVFAANTLGVALLQLFVLRLVAGRRRSTSLAVAAAVFGCAWCIAIVAAHAGGGDAAVVLFATAMAVLALGETLVSPALGPIVNDLAPDHLRGHYNGTFVLAFTTGFVLAPTLAGSGLRIGDGTPYFGALVVGCAATAAWSLSLRRRLPAAVDFVEAGTVESVAVAEPT